MITYFAVPAGILALPAVLAARALRRDRLRPRYRPDRDDIATWHGVGPLAEPAPRVVIHHWPARGDGLLACCGGDPFADGTLLAVDQAQVTCGNERENR